MSKSKQNETGFIAILKYLYGEPNLNDPIKFTGRLRWNNEKELIYRVPIREPYLNNPSIFNKESAIINMEPIVSYKDNETGIYCRYKSQNIIEHYWQSESLYLEYLK